MHSRGLARVAAEAAQRPFTTAPAPDSFVQALFSKHPASNPQRVTANCKLLRMRPSHPGAHTRVMDCVRPVKDMLALDADGAPARSDSAAPVADPGAGLPGAAKPSSPPYCPERAAPKEDWVAKIGGVPLPPAYRDAAGESEAVRSGGVRGGVTPACRRRCVCYPHVRMLCTLFHSSDKQRH